MKHTKFKEQLQFYLSDELNMNDKKLLEDHIRSCKECSGELKEYQKLFEEFGKDATTLVDQNFLNEARAELRGYLKAQKKNKLMQRDLFQVISEFFTRPIGFAFSGIAFLFMGGLISYLIFNANSSEIIENNLKQPDYLKVQNVNFIDSDPSDGQVEFTFESVKAERKSGSINDPEIQKLITFAVLNEQNPGTRLNSINVINANQTMRNDDEIKSTLIAVAKYDDNIGVRLEAVKSLNQLTVDDQIKNTLIYVLLNDTSAGIRIEAINALVEGSKSGINLNQKDLLLLKEKIQSDENNYIRYQAKNIIKEY